MNLRFPLDQIMWLIHFQPIVSGHPWIGSNPLALHDFVVYHRRLYLSQRKQKVSKCWVYHHKHTSITSLSQSEIVSLNYQWLFLPNSIDIVWQNALCNCKVYQNNTKLTRFASSTKMAPEIKIMLKYPAGLHTCVFVYIAIVAQTD